jgi:hypothetical protein
LDVDQRDKDHVDMIGHNDKRAKVERPGLCADARIHDDGASPVGQYPTPVGTKRQEVGFEVTLEVREIATV